MTIVEAHGKQRVVARVDVSCKYPPQELLLVINCAHQCCTRQVHRCIYLPCWSPRMTCLTTPCHHTQPTQKLRNSEPTYILTCCFTRQCHHQARRRLPLLSSRALLHHGPVYAAMPRRLLRAARHRQMHKSSQR
jgi:hypothetical protein